MRTLHATLSRSRLPAPASLTSRALANPLSSLPRRPSPTVQCRFAGPSSTVIFGLLAVLHQEVWRKPLKERHQYPPPLLASRFDTERYKPLYDLTAKIIRTRLARLETQPHFTSKELSASLSVPLPALQPEDTIVVKVTFLFSQAFPSPSLPYFPSNQSNTAVFIIPFFASYFVFVLCCSLLFFAFPDLFRGFT